MFTSVKEMTDAVKPAATVLSDRVSVTERVGCKPTTIVDKLAWTAAFGGDAELRGTARWIIRTLAAAAGIRPASIHDLYMAMGRGKRAGSRFRRSTSARWPTTRRAPSSGRRKPRCRRVHFRDRALRDRLHRAAAPRVRGDRDRGGAARGVQWPDLHPGRSRPDQREEVQQPRTRQGARHACARSSRKKSRPASTTSTSTPRRSSILTKPTLAEQQEVNVSLAADFAAFIREARAAGRHRVGRRRDWRGRRQELRRPRAARVHGRLQPRS